ncbi:cupin domain-containing protein [Kibdelosporangium phytohabitans]|uniref:Cupin n=1 Tax=Kibdelosporangium phytohabitans TaxID=860235 RepID=A0A0N9I4W4_9PSEU|nr:cupin domain-containing protein [Kibdelosporangium phytohabitans]ALG10917.1 cupin [Kibdelosporangium phytohabitans]MBE1462108.1 putative monooxygenase [Kibdelosporangium phytohabitans]
MTTARQLKFAAADAQPNRRRGGDLRVTLSPKTVGSTSGFGGVLWLKPGEHVTEHYHPYSEEFLHVVAGQVEMVVDDRPIRLGPGESLLVPIGARHRLVNVGEETAHAVFHLSPLAPRPELGHVDTEQLAAPSEPNPEVGSGR